MCGGELNNIANEIKDKTDELVKIHTAEARLCDICLSQLETLVKILKHYKTLESPSED